MCDFLTDFFMKKVYKKYSLNSLFSLNQIESEEFGDRNENKGTCPLMNHKERYS